MSRRLLPFVPASLSIVRVEPVTDAIVIHVAPRPTGTYCPGCSMPSRCHHGQYDRTLEDLPWQGRGVLLRLRLRRFLCLNAACPRRTFSENVEPVVRSHDRRSERLRDLQRHLGLALGGAPAARLARRLAMPVIRSGATVHPRVVRDWAMERRRASSDVLDALPRSVSAPLWQLPSINRTARLLQAEPSKLGELDRHFLNRLQVEAPELARSAALATRFADLVRRRSGESPEAWFTAASATLLARFAEGLRRDREALIFEAEA